MSPTKKEHLTNLLYAGMTISTITGLIGFYTWMDSIGAIHYFVKAFLVALVLSATYLFLYFLGFFVRKGVDKLHKFRNVK